jgi:[acyl-carrier-protein] S-malonyltransferase
MGQQLRDGLPEARALFEQADNLLGYELSEICFTGPVETLNATEHSQPALLLTSMAALEWLQQHEPALIDNCQQAAGLSLGEYTALVFAGALSFADGLQLVRQRGLAMQAAADARPSGMVSILGLEPPAVEELCEAARQPGEILQTANYLCPGNIVVSGDAASCQQVAALAEEHGAMRAVALAVAGAFHTPIMEPAKQRLTEALQAVTIRPPRIPVISNVDARPHQDPQEIRQLLIDQVSAPVRWQESMLWLLNEGVEEFAEVGTGRVLRGLMKRINRKARCRGIPE